MTEQNTKPLLPTVLCGPILRRCQTDSINVWLVCSEKTELNLELRQGDETQTYAWGALEQSSHVISVAPKCHIYLINLHLDEALTKDQWIHYDIKLKTKENGNWQGIAQWNPALCYPGEDSPRFVIHSKTRQLFHGSCRKPHHPSKDGLAQVDTYLLEHGMDPKRTRRP